MKQEDRLYKIRKLGNKHIVEKNVKYEVFGMTIPFPELHGRMCLMRRKPNKIFITILTEEELKVHKEKLVELKKQRIQNKLDERKKNSYKRMLEKKLITKEQYTKNLEPEPELKEVNAIGGIWYGIRKI